MYILQTIAVNKVFMKGIVKINFIPIMILVLLFLTRCEKGSDLPTDGDGNIYDTVHIGTQIWLAENLKTTKYNNGGSIPYVTDNDQWASTTSAAFCWYENNSIVKEDYGALYNWWAVNVSYLCPVDYHVSVKAEWQTLIDYLGGEEIAGEKLKATGTQFWTAENRATNESGFTAMPGGMRSPKDGTYSVMRNYGFWWGLTQAGEYATRLRMDHSSSNAIITNWFKESGFSVRCIKDN